MPVKGFLIPILYEDAPKYMRNEPRSCPLRVSLYDSACPKDIGAKNTKKERKSQENLAQPHKEMV
ncbi:hypothetical protein DP113_30620 [Brasilonema octagenarum UFV-E1]|uniref:Uncharacterized protein n=2 Tax=Brasilonema TaxID=383614 RepID=A0A856MQF1_9CYAN|nr:hypothetical protein [Brasilonema octagenarum UFV-OR1]QDL11647.1 hypothetical protein DP114_30480 [Brasilonema sennae CENA114]QDL18027.1 hypothetical protein DP113_30620 [Brasilonema octagenarum UFV-E1]